MRDVVDRPTMSSAGTCRCNFVDIAATSLACTGARAFLQPIAIGAIGGVVGLVPVCIARVCLPKASERID